MFFRKKSSQEPDDNVAKKGIKHVDSVVTGLILGGLIASIYGVNKLRKDHSEEGKWEKENEVEPPKKVGERGLLRRIIFGNK